VNRSSVTVCLVDVQTLVREALAESLASRGISVRQAAGLEQARPAFSKTDVLLAAHDFHNPHGIDTVEEYARSNARGHAATITHMLSPEVFAETLHRGGAGSVERDWPVDRLVAAIRSLAENQSIRQPDEIVRILTQAAHAENRRRSVERALARLTAREVEVLRCMACGLSGPEVAAKLYISDKTERTHVANILKKLRVRSKLQAVVFAAATGFVELSIREPAQSSHGPRPHSPTRSSSG
jgi:DNA-binding NarL/FixJ family response regulator